MKLRPSLPVWSVLLVAIALLFLAVSARAAVSVTTLARLGGDPNGYHSEAALIDGHDGFFYGTTEAGGPGNLGTIFKVAADGTLTTLYLFTGGSDGSNPTTALVAGGDGNFYGTTGGSSYLGLGSTGTVFRVTPAGVLTTLYTFSALDSNYNNADGARPVAALILGSDGNLYGVTEYGGPKGGGTVFRMTLAGTLTTLVNFDGNTLGSVFGPTTALVEGTDGNFYGLTEYGGTGPDITGDGAIYQVKPDGTLTTIYSFTNGADGSNPVNGLVRGTDGNFYSETQTTLFQVTPAGVLTTLHTFDTNNEGVSPLGLTAGTDGNLYGATGDRGLMGYGTIFKATTAGAITVLYSFIDYNAVGFAANPLLQGGDGNFYGTTQAKGTGYGGTFFQLTPAGALTVLHAFNSGGNYPTSPLVLSPEGNFYGTTTRGGTQGVGTVYGVTPGGTLLTELSLDDATVGSTPASGLVTNGAGNYYGFCDIDGPDGDGTVYEVSETTASQTSALLRSWVRDATPADNPFVDLILGPDAPRPVMQRPTHQLPNNHPTPVPFDPVDDVFKMKFSKTSGGDNGYGVVMNDDLLLQKFGSNIDTPGTLDDASSSLTETVVYTFTDGNDGAGPTGTLLVDADGTTYGTTFGGGAGGQGTVFQLTPSGTLNTLYAFKGTGDGSSPGAGIIRGSDGNFYGTTQYGNYDRNTGETTGNGTIFQLTPAGVFTTLHTFAGSGSGDTPEGGQVKAELIQASDGKFYGVTSLGGTIPASIPIDGGNPTQDGTVFSITPDGTFTTVYTFDTVPGDGKAPLAPLIAGSDGNLYGTTSTGGTDDNGVVFKVDLSATTTPPVGTPVVSSALSASAQVGVAFTYQITASNTPTSFAATGLPGGLNIDPATGIISGTPTAAGTFTVGLSSINASGTGTATLALTVAAAPVGTPVVTIAVVGDGMAVEGGENGKVAIRRDGDLTNPLVVRYKVVGGVVAGVDYKPLSGVATIPAGSAQVKVKIKPIDNTTVDGTRIAKVKLKAATDGSYTLGSPTAAKVKIIDND